MGRAAYATIPILPFFVMASVVVGNPLTTFKDQPAAQKYCQNDTVVWIDLPTHTYYLKDNPWYGLTKNGASVCGTKAKDAESHAVDKWSRVLLLEENDSFFFNSDKHYTQGLRLSAIPSPPRTGSG
jgi:hypothetical protein